MQVNASKFHQNKFPLSEMLNGPACMYGIQKDGPTEKHLLTYLFITPWKRVLLKKLAGPHLVKKFPAFYRARRFITAFTSARHLSLT